ncbi:MAG: hypothetical protein PHC35_08335 [Deltaproteobacteria bacterium]|jgi:hypothetical protein|nr:hypothetical protein [Deltaproteobacteria bacterium]
MARNAYQFEKRKKELEKKKKMDEKRQQRLNRNKPSESEGQAGDIQDAAGEPAGQETV